MMTFDIKSQQLKCGRCDRTESIEEADQREYRKAGNSFSVDVLTCPTCGAEIRAMNAAQAAFCSYCGASVMLEQRTADMEAPETVAPFRITREECFEKYRSMVKKSLLRAGLDAEKYSAHKLRHTAATLMLQNGVDVRTLQEVLGHEHLNTTQIYTHVDSSDLRTAASANPLGHYRPAAAPKPSRSHGKPASMLHAAPVLRT